MKKSMLEAKLCEFITAASNYIEMFQPTFLPPLLHGQNSGWATPPIMNGVVKNTPLCRQSILDRPVPGQSFYSRNFHACRIANALAHNLETHCILANITPGE
jgi:hypothetical protein